MTPAQTLLWLSLASPAPEIHGVPGVAISYQPVVDYWADVNLVPRFLARALVREESGNRPRAQSYEWKEGRHKIWYRTDKVLAQGLTQISVQYQDVHVRAAGMSVKAFRWWNPGDSCRVGFHLLRWLLDRYHGDQLLAIASYNCGYPRLESALPLPLETVKHLRKVFG
jgi:soluble lytic murein transglycosylase-like protein